VSEWQPIETAPKDGQYVIVYSPNNPTDYGIESVQVAHWCMYGSGWIVGAFDYEDSGWFRTHPTHWMPLPDAPKV
jgi:hypothetical protein